jgi:ABC-type phosphate transport system substrate-binding protein
MACMAVLSASCLENTEYKILTNTVEQKVVSTDELSYIYNGKIKSWDDGTRIKVFVRPYDDYLQKNFIVEIVGVSPMTFKENVKRNKHIKIVHKRDMLKTLARNIGSLGIINESTIYLSTNYGLRLLKVEDE